MTLSREFWICVYRALCMITGALRKALDIDKDDVK